MPQSLALPLASGESLARASGHWRAGDSPAPPGTHHAPCLSRKARMTQSLKMDLGSMMQTNLQLPPLDVQRKHISRLHAKQRQQELAWHRALPQSSEV